MDNIVLTKDEIRMLATTVEQAKELQSSLSEIDALLFNTKQSLEEKLDSVLSSRQKTFFVKLAKKRNLSLKVAADVTSLNSIIQETINSMPKLQMTLAFNPTVEQIESIADWLFVNCQKAYLLDIAVDSHIIGGAIVVANGKYRDYSLAKKLKVQSEKLKVTDQS